MPLSAPTLSNCYVPLPVTVVQEEGGGSNSEEGKKRCSGDGRYNSSGSGSGSSRDDESLRYLSMDRSVLSTTDGSSLVELGHTKVLCSVHGPRPAASSSLGMGSSKEFHAGGVLKCEIRFAPGFGIRPETRVLNAPMNLDNHNSNASSNNNSLEEMELSARLKDALSSAIPLEMLQKSVLDVYVLVLQADGAIFPATVTAATLALADAGVELYDLVSSCQVAISADSATTTKHNHKHNRLLLDPSEEETQQADGIVTLAMLSNLKEVTFWDQTGRLSDVTSKQALDLCRDGCLTMHKFMRNCLITPPKSSSHNNNREHTILP